MASPSNPLSVFLDADVLIAGAASPSGASNLVLRLGGLGVIDLVARAQVRAEVERNLRKKLPAALPAFGLLAQQTCRWIDDPASERMAAYADWAHPKDLSVLVAAIEASCSTLLTFNTRDFRPRRKVIRVETPGSFVAHVRALLASLAEPG